VPLTLIKSLNLAPALPHMLKTSFSDFKKLLKKVKKVVILTHWSPDGDAMGSSLGMMHYLQKLGKTVKVIVPNAYPDFLHWLPGNKQVVNYQNDPAKAARIIKSSEVIFTLDFNSYSRLEELGKLIDQQPVPKVLIDHHQQPEDYPDYYFWDIKACSTCELIFEFITGMGDKKLLDRKIASSLYCGIMTDTGSFRYPSVTSKTHMVIAELLKTGIVPSDIHGAVYDSYSYSRLKLLGFALNEKLKLVEGYPAAYFTLSENELARFNYQKGDIEGLVNYPFSIKGIKVCALFNEGDNGVKVSFRSKGTIDMNKFARKYFNGGGHINAAGGKSNESLAATEKKFVELVKTLF
jgi:phosphoesterase RecJ-like protein